MPYDFDISLNDSVRALVRALALMGEQGVPAIPQNYAVWYGYVTRNNEELHHEIDRQMNAGSHFTPAVCRHIYEHIYLEESQAKVDGVRESMRGAMQSMIAALTALGADFGRFSGLLDHAGASLQGTLSQDDLQRLVIDLARETRRTKARSCRVEWSLATMVDELMTLRVELNRLTRDSRTDPLTQIANRRAFDEALRRMTYDAENDDVPLCLILADIDHFKHFNDRHGHLVGDHVLHFVAAEMERCVKGRDLLARYGGEEFAILLPSTRLEGALALAENIRAAIDAASLDAVPIEAERARERPGRCCYGSYKVTVSFGAAEYRYGESIPEFIGRADACLYHSKAHGRNAVTGECGLVARRSSAR